MRRWPAALLLSWLALAGARDGRAPAAEEPPPSRPLADEELSPEDREILEHLDLLLDLELLEDWDPAEDLPIPVDAEPPQ